MLCLIFRANKLRVSVYNCDTVLFYTVNTELSNGDLALICDFKIIHLLADTKLNRPCFMIIKIYKFLQYRIWYTDEVNLGYRFHNLLLLKISRMNNIIEVELF